MNISSVPPPVESLTGSTGDWDGLKNISLPQEITNRRKLRSELDRLSLNQPIEELTELYHSMNELLESGHNDRFILYCPLCLIPAANWYRKYDRAIDTFAELYLESWSRLLHVYDIQANFVDGDLPDTTNRKPLERVQAAYLAPTLLAKQLISSNQLTTHDDDTLRKSFDEAFLPDQPIKKYTIPNNGFDQFVTDQLNKIEIPTEVDQKRANWLQWDKQRKTLEGIGKSLGTLILTNNTPNLALLKDINTTNAAIVGIGSAIEQLTLQDEAKKALELYHQYEHLLISLASRPALHDYTSRTFCRLHSIGIIDKNKLKELDIFLPCLEGPLHNNLSAIEDKRKIIRNLLKDNELTNIIYPIVIIFGSRLKGYGGTEADTDLAVFIRPRTKNHDQVNQLLHSKFKQEIVQYWLDKDGNNLHIHDFPDTKATIGNSTDTHVLFNGAWEGELDSISTLGDTLLKPYIQKSGLEKWNETFSNIDYYTVATKDTAPPKPIEYSGLKATEQSPPNYIQPTYSSPRVIKPIRKLVSLTLKKQITQYYGTRLETNTTRHTKNMVQNPPQMQKLRKSTRTQSTNQLDANNRISLGTTSWTLPRTPRPQRFSQRNRIPIG